MGLKRFYYAADWGFGKYADVENVLVSVASMYDKKNGLRINKSMIPATVKRLFVDSGGFSFASKWGEYPFTVEEFVSFVGLLSDEFPVTEVAIMDYPCEPSVNRSILKNNATRIRATVSNALDCMDADCSLPWLPVVQGYELNEYLWCLELYRNNLISVDNFSYWAIGSLCARKKTGGLRRIITKLKEEINQAIHVFGMTITALRDPQIFFSVESSDSGAWSFMANNEQKAIDLKEYKRKIERLMLGFEGQCKLDV